MKWDETIASECRYGDVAKRIFGDAEIIWEHSLDDYQGYVSVLAAMPDGSFIHYEWTYGSCSGCDEWEDRFGSYWIEDDDEDAENNGAVKKIEAEMRQGLAILKDRETLKSYLRLEGEHEGAAVPTSNDPTNGSVPGMVRYLSGDVGDEFKSMGEAALKWLSGNSR
jgi:hypothetical protein